MLHAQTLGDGAPVLFLHGLFGEGENLKSLARPLGASHKIHLVDLPNHGQSPATDSTDYIRMSDAVEEYARSIGGRVGLLGHSMGGKVAMALALRAPQLVSALIVLDIAPRRFQPSHVEIMEALLSLDLGSLDGRSEADELLQSAIPSRPVRSFLLKNLVHEDGEYRWKLNLPTLRSSYQSILDWPGDELGRREYHGPALFIAGSESSYLKPDRDRNGINALFPDATIEVVGGAGHWIHAEKPQEVVELIMPVLGGA